MTSNILPIVGFTFTSSKHKLAKHPLPHPNFKKYIYIYIYIILDCQVKLKMKITDFENDQTFGGLI